MKLLIAFLFSLTLLLAADQPSKKAAPVTIPSSAVKSEDGSYRYTDSYGKKWIYRKTPFGVMRLEDKPVSANAAEKLQDDRTRLIESTSAIEEGDAIRFERAWPFGRTQWQRKKTELNDVERAVWDRELQKRQAHQSASKD